MINMKLLCFNFICVFTVLFLQYSEKYSLGYTQQRNKPIKGSTLLSSLKEINSNLMMKQMSISIDSLGNPFEYK